MRSRGTTTVLLAALIIIAALIGSSSAYADVPAPGDFSPAIWSDKADYSPGEHVVLSGANWQPGESVHITVNDDAGSTWNRSVDVTADAAGTIADEFDLPSWFVAQYSVRAEGASGAVATYSFTDGNVTFTSDLSPNTTNFTVTYSHWTNDSCIGTPDQTGLTFISNGSNNLTVSGSSESIRPTSATTSGSTFQFFADTSTPTVPLTTAQLCQSGKGT